MLPENVERKLDQVVVIEPEALLLLVEITVENDILRRHRRKILVPEDLQRHCDHVEVVFRLGEAFPDLDHVAGISEGHIPEREPALLVDDLQHLVDVRVVEDKKALRVGHRVAVLLQHGNAEAVKCIHVPRIIVPGQAVNALPHLRGGLVGECDAEDISRQDPELLHKVGEAVRERTGLAGARARNHAHVPLRTGNRLKLRGVQPFKKIHHLTAPYPNTCEAPGTPRIFVPARINRLTQKSVKCKNIRSTFHFPFPVL